MKISKRLLCTVSIVIYFITIFPNEVCGKVSSLSLFYRSGFKPVRSKYLDCEPIQFDMCWFLTKPNFSER